MTQSVPPPQDLAAATFRGWGEVTSAWIKAATRWWFTILEWAVDECAYTGVNQTTTYAIVGKSTPLTGRFHPVGGNPAAYIADTAVTIGHATDAALAKTAAPKRAAAAPAGGPLLLVVTIRPSQNVPPGGYRGDVFDADGNKVAESLYIYVATDTSPATAGLGP